MTSVLIVEPNNIKVREKKENEVYTFLDFIKGTYNMDIEKYYALLNSIDSFKLKNVYRNLYIRTFILHKKDTSIRCLENINCKISGRNFDRYLNEYINREDRLLHSIIIMNKIYSYFYPSN